MGTFNVEIEVSDSQKQRSRTLDALVDTGATYPIIPRSVMGFLRIEVAERRSFVLADDRRAEFDVGVVTLRLAGRSFPVLAVFGNNSAQPVLGTVALETFGLGADPVNRRLMPVTGLMM